ncbi:mitochondrial genome maintenance exonuclease 1 [Tachyglossus aculeatus]|uniref:mitochondrial genome maintenance exonuclease 1 n=1 Tax=Tachyglossus aculeatus TaxID=9261 RepID=UPI0018F54BE7|nr:mitochondrial genome maintenance exonuclease 1 [Tachyglossus aculeatus]
MQSLQSIFRKCRRSKGMLSELVPRVGFSSSSRSCNRKKKKGSPYEEVDQEKYSNLINSVISAKVRSRTPETLFQEDHLLYGPVSRRKPPEQDSEPRVPRNWIPLVDPEREASPIPLQDSSLPLKIPLQKSKIPSVTRVLQQTMPPEQAFYLERWKRRMILELGEDGFAEYTKNVFLQGKLFHTAIEAVLSSGSAQEEDDKDAVDSGYLRSVRPILADVTGVRALESAVQHEILKYQGLVDCVAEYRGKLCVIDWKTSEKPKPSIQNTFDNPLQVAAYVGAINHDANYSFQVHCGLIVVAYKDGSPAHSHFLHSEICSQYWSRWLLRLEDFKEKEKNQSIQQPD